MLEAYCRGCGDYRSELTSQVNALNKMTQVSNSSPIIYTAMYTFTLYMYMQVTTSFQAQKKKSDELLRVLKEHDFKVVMENVSSPLDPTLRFRDLKSVTSL